MYVWELFFIKTDLEFKQKTNNLFMNIYIEQTFNFYRSNSN